MCIQKAPQCWTAQLYERYEQSIADYLDKIALPAILSSKADYLLKELVKRWNDHRIIKQWMCDFFRYLNRFYVKRHNKKALEEVGTSRVRRCPLLHALTVLRAP
jgi:cullin 1